MGIKDQIQEEREKTTEKDPHGKQDFINFKISVINLQEKRLTKMKISLKKYNL